MGTIKSKVDKILLQKQTLVKPENIRDGITVMGVTGTLHEGIDTSDATATAGEILKNKTAYVNGSKLTGSMKNIGQLNIVPTTHSQSLEAGYISGGTVNAVTASIDSNIVPENIVQGITILGVLGNATIDMTDTTATKDNILQGKTAYLADGIQTGTMTNNGQVIITPSTIDKAIPQGYHNGRGYVKAIDNTVDVNIQPNNIKQGVTILGVTGTLGNLDTSDATANTSTILYGQTAYVNGQKITGSMINRGYLRFDPSTADQIISPGYTSGGIVNKVTANIDQNIIPGNIKQGVTILGVTGALTDQGIDTSDATATTANILETKTAYVNGSKLTGTMSNRGNLTITPSTSTQTFNSGYYSTILTNAVSSTIDANIQPNNIKAGTTILGVTGTLVPSAITPVDYTIYPSDTRLTYNDIYCRSLIIEKADSRVDSNIQPQNIRKNVTILGVTGTLETGVSYEAGTLTILAGKYINYNPIKQDGTGTVTEFDNNDFCVVTNGNYTYIRCYFSLMQEQDLQFTYTVGSNSKILYSTVDSEMGKNSSDLTTNVYYNSNGTLTSTVTYTSVNAGKHFIDVKIISTNNSDINKFKPIGINIRQKLISQIYPSTDAMDADLSQAVGTFGFLFSISAMTMTAVYRFDGEKWVEKVIGDYTGTVTPAEYSNLITLADDLNGEVIT